MPDVSDDMDDLFRRAAANYPLNANNPDWDKVHRAMQSDIPGQDSAKKNKYRKLLWLLLLLPVILAVIIYAPRNQTGTLTKSNSIQKHTTPNNQDSSYQAGTNRKIIISNNEARQLSLSKDPTSSSNTNLNKLGKKDEIFNSIPDHYTVGRNHLLKVKTIAAPVAGSIENRINKISDEIENIGIDKEKINKAEIINASPRPDNTSSSMGTKEIRSKPLIENQTKALETTPAAASDTFRSNNAAKIHKPNTVKKGREPHLYAGIIGGPDVSTVKLQKIMKAGFTAGILAGYRLSKKLSIESGLSITKKYYYSEGAYFNTKHLYLPYWVKIDNVDGDCRMIEFPVNLKYDFTSKDNIKWFMVIGTSSYFMKKENYGYRYNSYGQQVEKTLSFDESSKAWASVLNLSLGYSRAIGKTGTFRIEPYIKIPFKGIGIGSLPITSSGVYLGFTKNIF